MERAKAWDWAAYRDAVIDAAWYLRMALRDLSAAYRALRFFSDSETVKKALELIEKAATEIDDARSMLEALRGDP